MSKTKVATIKTLGSPDLVAKVHNVIGDNFEIVSSTGQRLNDRDPGVHEIITIVEEDAQP